MHKSSVFVGVVFALGCSTTTFAGQIGLISPNQSGVVQQVAAHNCMRDEKGWHYMDKDRRFDCKPPHPKGADWGWKCEGGRCGWWHAKEHRWNDA